jgi:hypothetical protein
MVVNNEFGSFGKEAVVAQVEELHWKLPLKMDELTKNLNQDFLTLTWTLDIPNTTLNQHCQMPECVTQLNM